MGHQLFYLVQPCQVILGLRNDPWKENGIQPLCFCLYIYALAISPILEIIRESTSTLQQLVYVIGLHAVQFGNNWMKKFRGQPILDEASSNFAVRGILILNLIISKLDKHVVLLPINFIASQTIQRERLFPERKTHSNSKLT